MSIILAIVAKVGQVSKVAYLESVKLNVGIAVGEALDHALDSFLWSITVSSNSVAHFHDRAPVLRSGILVGRLGCSSIVSGLLRDEKLNLQVNTNR